MGQLYELRHPFRAGQAWPESRGAGGSPETVVASAGESGVVLQDGRRVRLLPRARRARLCGGGAVASMTVLARQGAEGELVAAVASGAPERALPALPTLRVASGQRVAVTLEGGGEEQRALVVDVREAADGSLHALVRVESDDSRHWLHLSRDAGRISVLEEQAPEDLVGGLAVEVRVRSEWVRAVVESVDPDADALVVSLLNERDLGQQRVVALRHGAACRVRSATGGPVQLRGVVYSSEGAAGAGGGACATTAATVASTTAGSDECADAADLAPLAAGGLGPGLSLGQQAAQQAPQERAVRGWQPSFCRAHLSGGAQGLANLGNTCFLNAVLQCLMHCGPLVQVLAESRAWEGGAGAGTAGSAGAERRLVAAFMQVVQRHWTAGVSDVARSAFRPLLVKKVVAESAPQFSGSRQHDAQELLVMLLDAMHEELNSRKGAGYAELKDAPELSDAVLSKRWWDNYARANESCLKDLFVGQIHSRVTCTSCRCTSSTFDPFWSLSVPLPPAARETTLEACLALFTRLETLTGANRYFCQKCKTAQDSTKQLALYRCPRLLVLHAKRFSTREDQAARVFDKLGHAVTPTTDALNLRPYCASSAHLDANGRPGTLLYDLVAVTNHHGESGTHGHYTADCYEPLTDAWLTYDDSNVHPTKHIDPHAAYLFFYVRRDSS